MFSVRNLQLGRGITTSTAQGSGTSVIHSYIDDQTTVANIKLAFPPFLDQGSDQDFVLLTDYMFITGSDTAILARITSLDPFTVDVDLFSGAAGLSVAAPIPPVDANAAKITAGVLQMEFADQTHPGIMSAAPQDFGGEKTFHDNVKIIDPVNGLIIQKTMGDFGVDLLTSDNTARPGFAIDNTNFPGQTMGIAYAGNGFFGGNPQITFFAGNDANIILDNVDQSVFIGSNLITNNIDSNPGQVLNIGQNNATEVTVYKQLNVTAGHNISVDEVDVFTPGTLKIGGTDTTDVAFPKPVSFATPGGTPGLLNDYEEYDHVSTFTNNTETSAAVTIRFVRVGDAVTALLKTDVSVPGQVAPNANFVSDTVLPARFRPATDVNGLFIITNNAISSVGAIVINPTGDIQIFNNADFTTTFTAAVTNGFYSGSLPAYTLN